MPSSKWNSRSRQGFTLYQYLLIIGFSIGFLGLAVGFGLMCFSNTAAVEQYVPYIATLMCGSLFVWGLFSILFGKSLLKDMPPQEEGTAIAGFGKVLLVLSAVIALTAIIVR